MENMQQSSKTWHDVTHQSCFFFNFIASEKTWLLCRPVPSVAVVRMCRVVSKRWARLSRAAMHSSLSDWWQHRSTSWMQQPNGLANAWSSPTASMNKNGSVTKETILYVLSHRTVHTFVRSDSFFILNLSSGKCDWLFPSSDHPNRFLNRTPSK